MIPRGEANMSRRGGWNGGSEALACLLMENTSLCWSVLSHLIEGLPAAL